MLMLILVVNFNLKQKQVHIKQKHTQTAPKFRCEICKTLLGRKCNLNTHIRKFHDFQETPTECRYCDEQFHDRYSLMQHQKTHINSAKNIVRCKKVFVN